MAVYLFQYEMLLPWERIIYLHSLGVSCFPALSQQETELLIKRLLGSESESQGENYMVLKTFHGSEGKAQRAQSSAKVVVLGTAKSYPSDAMMVYTGKSHVNLNKCIDSPSSLVRLQEISLNRFWQKADKKNEGNLIITCSAWNTILLVLNQDFSILVPADYFAPFFRNASA